MIVRFQLDAALYAPVVDRKPGQKGRKSQQGDGLPTLEAVAADPTTGWQNITVPNWYGQQEQVVEIVTDTALWYHNGLPPLPIRWVLIRDPHHVYFILEQNLPPLRHHFNVGSNLCAPLFPITNNVSRFLGPRTPMNFCARMGDTHKNEISAYE